MQSTSSSPWLTTAGELLATALVSLLVLYWVAKPSGATATPVRSGDTLAQAIPTVRFTDITVAAGITFVHHNGARGEKLLPETTGSGVVFFDFDGDGHQDLLLVNSTDWPGQGASSTPPPRQALYRNDGHGKFVDATEGSGLDISLYAMGAAIGDYDNDGRPDVFLTAVGGNRLFHNEGGGKFKEVTATAGVSGSGSDWSTSAAWIDYDNDGRLDLFVCNYVRWTRELDLQVDYRLPGIGRAYGPPLNFPGSFSYLYYNEGEGRFRDVSAAAGVQVRNPGTGLPLGKALGVAPVDLDGDGWMDLIVANDTVQNFVFHNEHGTRFREVGAFSGLAFDTYGGTRGAMGIDAGRFQADRALGVLIGNFANEMTALYVATNNALLFTDEAIAQGIGPASRSVLTFGAWFFDYDLDGWLDLLTVNGHVEPDIARADPRQRYAQPAQLFWNLRGGDRQGYTLVPPLKSGPDLDRPIVGRGSAFADIDGDGDLDVVITQTGGPPVLLRNDQALGHHWLRLRLVGVKSNRDAIGAWIKVRVGARTLWRQVMPTRGYMSQSELPVTIGLGAATRAEEVEIIWPDGSRQKVTDPQLDGLTVVWQAP